MSADHDYEPVLNNPRLKRTILWGLGLFCALLLAVDLSGLVHLHGGYEWEETHGLYALAGFASYLFLIVVAKQWRKVVMRSEDYYGPTPFPEGGFEPANPNDSKQEPSS